MKLSKPIQEYFDAERSDDANRVARAFADDGRVSDEGHTHIGHSDIAVWWRTSKDKYQQSTQPFEAETSGDVTKARATVTGHFPGSPATLTFAFQLVGDRIARLEVTA